ncbi:MAG: MBL fold metallo-hydrolase [Bacillota bacterium]
MKVQKLQVGYLQTNCYIVTCEEQREAAVIDPGGNYETIKAYLDQNNKVAAAVLLTHGHFDHIMAAKKLQDTGAKVYINVLDGDMLQNSGYTTRDLGIKIPPFYADKLFVDNDIIKVGKLEFKALHTPGHTKGSSCFVIEDTIFSGDTMFYQNYGRTDFRGGSQEAIERSLKKLMSLEGDYKVLPGHMEITTLDHERKHNPVVR